MKLHIIMGLRPDSEVPEAIDCWDEYTIDANPEGFDEAVAKAKEKIPSFFSTVDVVVVSVSTKAVMAILSPPNDVQGTVVAKD
jgi:hypothetical protein